MVSGILDLEISLMAKGKKEEHRVTWCRFHLGDNPDDIISDGARKCMAK